MDKLCDYFPVRMWTSCFYYNTVYVDELSVLYPRVYVEQLCVL